MSSCFCFCFFPHRSHLASGQADGNTSQPFSQSSDAKWLFWPVLNNQQPVRCPGLMHEIQAILLMNARVLGNGSSLTALLRTDSVPGWASSVHLSLSLRSFLVLFRTCLTHSGRSVPVDKTGECTKCTHIRTRRKQFLYLNTLALDNYNTFFVLFFLVFVLISLL